MKSLFQIVFIILLTVSCGKEIMPEEILLNTSFPVSQKKMAMPEKVTLVDSEEFFPFMDSPNLMSFKDKLWIIGGNSSGRNDDFHNDVWMSEDGISWNKVVDNIFNDDRKNYHVITVVDQLIIYGGSVINPDGKKNYPKEMWKSTDGINWSKLDLSEKIININWSGTISANNTFVLLSVISLKNDFVQYDVYATDDFKNWTHFPEPVTLFDLSRRIIYKNAYVEIPRFGIHPNIRKTRDFYNWEEVQISNEETARQLNITSETNRRMGYGIVVHNESLYIMGGTGDFSSPPYERYLNDVWKTENLSNWQLMTELSDGERDYEEYHYKSFEPRENPNVVSFQGMIYVTGGRSRPYHDQDKSNALRDAWVSPNGKDWYELARVK